MRSPKLKFEIRKQRTRAKIAKVSKRIRLSVFKSNQHIYAQIIDDVNSLTIVSASTLDKAIKQTNKSNCNKDAAIKVGELLAIRAAEKNIVDVVFDKGGYKYHGVIKALADATKKQLNF
jgi:large subunit ribosomal protein L18